MNLAKGTLLGPYEVESLLGAGGMGEVYRCRDSRLGRIVAVKVLPSRLTDNSDLRARFEREARAISALSDPHICAIYDVGRGDGADYLVMEYLEGETLADRIARGSLPLSHVLRYGAEIAEALQHAHRAGITHRDLKPGNIMLTSSGVKLLDFGLAKFAKPITAEAAEAATLVNPITTEGAIVGTVVYMSPEQLEGKSVDHRTDIFALGCILYEMATARRPFGGGSPASIAAAILGADPISLRTLQPTAPPALERIILTALEKRADDRWQTAHDVARQLRWLADSSTSHDAVVASPATTPPRRRLAVTLVAAAALGGLVTWGALRSFSPAPQQPFAAHLTLAPPPDVRPIGNPETPNFALSPDGRTLCFVAARGGGPALFLRRLDSFEVTKVEGTDGASAPFWSSDGAWIAFGARGRLWKTRAAGPAVPEPICDIGGNGAAGSWVGDTILFHDRPPGRPEIFRVSASGGPPVKATTMAAGEFRHLWARLLPDGRHFLHHIATANSLERRLVLASLDSPESSVLLRNVSQTALVAPDQLAYVRDGKLLVQHFDAAKGVMAGEPALIANDVGYFTPTARANYDAANGVFVYRTDTSVGRLVMTDRQGKSRVIDDRGPYDDFSLSISPDGRQAAVTVLDRGTSLGEIWIYDLARGVRDRFTNEGGLALSPIWSPDGKSMIYSAAGQRLPHLMRRVLATPTAVDLKAEGNFQFGSSFTPDGSTVFYTRTEGGTKADIFRIDLRTGKSEPVLAGSFNELDPQLSPDGRWMAFTSDETGEFEVYLQSLSAGEVPRIRVSTNGGSYPRWRGDGSELLYLSRQNVIVSVVPRSSRDWTDAFATNLFTAPPDTIRYAVSPDAQSLLFTQGAPGPSDGVFHVIVGYHSF